MDIAAFFSNAWVVGIGGGILSGLAVTFATRAAFSGRDNREYVQKLQNANREVIYAVRPGISEGLIPASDVLDSIIQATARKYGVEQKDLYHSREIAQELMKEVMDSSFISAKTKEEYCTRLNAIAKHQIAAPLTPQQSIDAKKEERRSVAVEEYRSRMITMMSAMLGVIAAVMTAFIAIIDQKSLTLLWLGNSGKGFTAIVGPILLILFAAGGYMLVLMLSRNFLLFARRHDQNLDHAISKDADSGDRGKV